MSVQNLCVHIAHIYIQPFKTLSGIRFYFLIAAPHTWTKVTAQPRQCEMKSITVSVIFFYTVRCLSWVKVIGNPALEYTAWVYIVTSNRCP